MPEHLDPSPVASEPALTDSDRQDNLRLLSRSPHPYHRQLVDILEPSGSYPPVRELAKDSSPPTDSGTEADDEHFLKGLPAPRRLHKGLRGHNEASSGASTPFLAPIASLDEDGRAVPRGAKQDASWIQPPQTTVAERRKRKKAKEILRRSTELLLLGGLSLFVCANADVRPILLQLGQEIRYAIYATASLLALYPARLLVWTYWHRRPSRTIPLTVPPSFDPAPLLYPLMITILVSSLIAVNNSAILLPNIILALCSLPHALIPTLSPVGEDISPVHWVLTLAPLLPLPISAGSPGLRTVHGQMTGTPTGFSLETATLLYPLHCTLLRVLYSLTTTSLLPSELQLLSVALINILLFSSSPQITILKAMLWVGGLDILVSCSNPVQWGIALARVPKWRFRRPSKPVKRNVSSFLSPLMSWRRLTHDLFHAPLDGSSCSSCEAIDDPHDSADPSARVSRELVRVRTVNVDGAPWTRELEGSSLSGGESGHGKKTETVKARRHTLPGMSRRRKPQTHTPSGRKKRSTSASVKAFASLTYTQALFRKWIYAAYVYLCIIGTVFIPLPTIGVKEVVAQDALNGDEPVGWALGYLFGNVQWFRWQVVSHNLGWWICLPPRFSPSSSMGGAQEYGWVQHFRASFGEANTRLLLCAYCVAIIFIGLVVVFRLSPVCEVDTRRKVFHFMMVAMFLPATYIDPCFVALALSIVLAAFLLLDLLRASQLPPLSKPLAHFLAPYVDGRDLRGPVVISHIFLLIGCAIPVWLSLGSLGRTGDGHLRGWEVPTREVAMVSGVVCVGLGDAAASLVGRRYGRRKWLWGGGKSLEGSIAFAIAVFLGLMAAHIWLRLGGWPTTNQSVDTLQATMHKAGVCAGIASLTETVLTGGNDNVIVPVVLWTCVKSLGV